MPEYWDRYHCLGCNHDEYIEKLKADPTVEWSWTTEGMIGVIDGVIDTGMPCPNCGQHMFLMQSWRGLDWKQSVAGIALGKDK